jgi:type IV pilus assembly protein PilB
VLQQITKHSDFLSVPVANDLGDIIAYTNGLFDHAITLRASDVHIEPNRDCVNIRFRSSGDFVFVDKVSMEEYAKLLSRIKILSNLRIDEKQRPQDGKISYTSEANEETIDIRVSVLPLVEGEKVVMRILRQDTSLLALDKLNFSDTNMARIHSSLESKYGLILVAGPTGSGKSTTLFSMLKHFNPLEYNISTLEDPVEYNIQYINQSQVKPNIGYTFVEGLRSLVRQDPDIIMVGEIRDKETAMLAIEAALTGHLVLSTIHTNSAAGTIQRLVNMGVEPFLISSALKMIISQRLVKRMCPHCKKEWKIENPLTLKKVEDEIGHFFDESIEYIDFFKPIWCDKCWDTGYKWRIGVHEVLTMSEEYNTLIMSNSSENDIDLKARELGMISIVQDAIIKSISGDTSIDESLQLI